MESQDSQERLPAGFSAPDARVLVVDDNLTNVKVAIGLMAPYRFRLDTCLSGEEAVRLAGENRYDLIFMDHMMPGMDGMEATAAIRKNEDPFSDPVTVVALTANAVSGMRETFLSGGFDDYLPKPIDLNVLNDMLEKWIPEYKKRDPVTPAEAWEAAAQPGSGRIPQNRDGSGGLFPDDGSGDPESASPYAGSGPGFPVRAGSPASGLNGGLPRIAGVDAEKGLEMSGGSLAGFRDLLDTFATDAEGRIARLEMPEEGPLKSLVTDIHALKSGAACIGAQDLSSKAERLEGFGREDKRDPLEDGLPAFREELGGLLTAIRGYLSEIGPKGAGKSGKEGVKPDQGKLISLEEAIRKRDIDGIDTVLDELTAGIDAYEDEAAKGVSEIGTLILMSDFEAALDLLAGLIDSGRRD
jgi:CheY-like chemotaxis protein